MWSLLNNNIYCAEKEQLKVNQIHFEKLLNTKARLDNKPSEIPFFLKNKSYLKELIRTRDTKINYINNMMNKKLKFVSKSPSQYSSFINSPKYCPALDKQRFNFARIEREREIHSENISLYKRFKEKKPTYSTKIFLKKSENLERIKNNISKGRHIQKFSLKLCTFREFKTNLMRESSKLRGKMKSLNETSLSNNNLYNTKSLEYPNSFNNVLNFSSDNNNSLSIRNLGNKKSRIKLKYMKNKINNIKHLNSKQVNFKS